MLAVISLVCFRFMTSDESLVLDKASIYSGDLFSVTCDGKSFGELQADDASSLTHLTLERKTAFDSKFTNIATYGDNTSIKFFIALFGWSAAVVTSLQVTYVYNQDKQFPVSIQKLLLISSDAPGARPEFVSIPHGGSWNILFNNGTESTIKPSSIVLYVREACCSDAGLYRCIATLNNTEVVISDTAELKCKDLVENASLSKEINAQGKTQLICVFSSMFPLQVQWKYKTTSSDETFPYQGYAYSVGPVNLHDCRGCKQFFHMSKLFLNVSVAEDKNTYFCSWLYDTVKVT